MLKTRNKAYRKGSEVAFSSCGCGSEVSWKHTVRGRPGARDSPYKTQMVKFERCIGPWVEETLATTLIIRGAADKCDFTDS